MTGYPSIVSQPSLVTDKEITPMHFQRSDRILNWHPHRALAPISLPPHLSLAALVQIWIQASNLTSPLILHNIPTSTTLNTLDSRSRSPQRAVMSTPSSGASTPNPRFKPQAKTAEDILSNQTVGLVNLSDFRKRRAEAIEQKERDAQESLLGSSRGGSGAATPVVGSG